jgi:hypothetical protein
MTSSQTSRDVVDVLISDHRDVTALIGEIWSVMDPMIRRDLTDTAITEQRRIPVIRRCRVVDQIRGSSQKT